MSDMPVPQQSRFGELAMELLGAKMASDLVRDVWQTASGDVKQQLAGSVIAAIAKRPIDDYMIRHVVESWIVTTARAIMDEPAREDAMRASIAARIDAVWQKTVESSVETLVRAVVAKALQATGEAIKLQLDKHVRDAR